MSDFGTGLLGGIASGMEANRMKTSKPVGFKASPIGKLVKKIRSFDKGGKVKRTGLAKLHKGEYVETKEEATRRGRNKTPKRKSRARSRY